MLISKKKSYKERNTKIADIINGLCTPRAKMIGMPNNLRISYLKKPQRIIKNIMKIIKIK